MIRTIRFNKCNREFLVKQIDKMNKKADKLKVDRIKIISEVETVQEATDFVTYEPIIEMEIVYDLITVGTHKILAHINHTYDNGNIVTLIDKDYEVQSPYYKIGGYCQHCNINHARKTTFLILDENQIVKQIGKTCLKEYTGYDVEKILNIAEWFSNIDEYLANLDNENRGDREYKQYKTVDILNMTKILIDEVGYISSKKRDELFENSGVIVDSTTDSIKEILFSKGKFSNNTLEKVYREYHEMKYANETIEEVENALKWIRDMSNDEAIKSQYLNNLKVLCSSEYISYKHLGYVTSLLASYKRNTENTVKREQVKAEKKLSEYIGAEGQKLEINVTCKKINRFESMFGSGLIYIFEDDNKNVVTWMTGKFDFQCKEDEELKIKCTVKSHELYGDTKQTKVIRVKKI